MLHGDWEGCRSISCHPASVSCHHWPWLGEVFSSGHGEVVTSSIVNVTGIKVRVVRVPITPDLVVDGVEDQREEGWEVDVDGASMAAGGIEDCPELVADPGPGGGGGCSSECMPIC